jgi:non-specific serine/threonine protein kinase
MELLEGQTFKALVESGPVRPDRLLELAIQVADGLEAAHVKGIVHRDIKPANIFLTRSGQVKILDFGLAKLVPGLDAASAIQSEVATAVQKGELTSPGSTLGTPLYMSPEQARGEPLDARSDLFSFGAVLYELATGARAFDGGTAAVVFQAIFNETPRPSRHNPALPQELDRIIGKALEKDPELRYQTAAKLRSDLRRLRRDLDSGKSQAASDSGPVPAAARSVAVLYFENLSSAKDDEYFRDGMTEDIITELTKIEDLKVFPRPAVMTYRDRPVTAPEVGRELSAAYVVSGSLRRAGNRLRVSAQLIQTGTGLAVWAERFDRQMEDVFEVRTRSRAASRGAQDQAVAARASDRQQADREPQAYDATCGRAASRRVTRTDLDFALQMYERAIALDPASPSPTQASPTCAASAEWHRPTRAGSEGTAASGRASSSRPTCPRRSRRTRGSLTPKDYEKAARLGEQAVALKPDCDGALHAAAPASRATAGAGGRHRCRAVEAAATTTTSTSPSPTHCRAWAGRRAAEELAAAAATLNRHLETVPEDVRARSCARACT